MKQHPKITAIVGTYRKGGIMDQAVDVILEQAEQQGATTQKIFLADHPILFCTNCRTCTQSPGNTRGVCIHDDEMDSLLDSIDASDALVLASPMNFGTATAVMKRFIERLICYSYWPWGANAPVLRNPKKTKYSLIIASSAAPAAMARLTSRMTGLMKTASNLLGAKPVGVLSIGLAAGRKQPRLGRVHVWRARCMTKKLIARCGR